MRHAPCGNLNLEPFQFEIRAYAWAGSTWAAAGARTLEPATFIGMVITPDKRQPDGMGRGVHGQQGPRRRHAGSRRNVGDDFVQPGLHLPLAPQRHLRNHQNTTYTATSGTVVT
jgi:hypothetical protein